MDRRSADGRGRRERRAAVRRVDTPAVCDRARAGVQQPAGVRPRNRVDGQPAPGRQRRCRPTPHQRRRDRPHRQDHGGEPRRRPPHDLRDGDGLELEPGHLRGHRRHDERRPLARWRFPHVRQVLVRLVTGLPGPRRLCDPARQGGSSMKTAIAALIVTALLAIQACKSTDTPSAEEAPVLSETVAEATMVTIRGWIDAIDKTNRTVTLKGPRGGTVTLDVKDPQKLEAVAVGDPVVAAYMEALALQVKKVGSAPGVSVQEARAASKPGETPSATLGREVIVTATITAVDKRAQTVTIKGPRGNTETIKVKDPKNLQGVEAGNVVELIYTQALAITLDRAGQ